MKDKRKRGILINTEKKEDGQLSKERETFEILLEQINAYPDLRQHPLIQTAQIKQVVHSSPVKSLDILLAV